VLTTLPLLAMSALAVWRMIERGEPHVASIVGIAGLVLLLVLIGILFWMIGKLNTDFVVPMMFRRGSGCLKAWGVVLRLIAGNLGRFILYFLFQIVLAIAIVLLVVAAVVATCCILGCVMLIPYLGTVLLLPISVFRRAYSLYYLAQYGEEYDVFHPLPQ
jgi:hypothetical protein